MRFADVVAASAAVASTRSRTAKVATLADLLRRLDAVEIEPAVGFLVGDPRQGRVGVGWATMQAVDAARAAEPTLEILEIDALFDHVAATTGSGSGAARRAALDAVFGRATHAEAEFLYRVFGGELRQGALAGIMTDAIATAAGVPLATVRRAAMLTGDLRRTAHLALTEGEGALDAVGLTLMCPIEPMLAASAEDVASALALTGEASVEWKLDGIRVQVHRAGDDVRVFTRNLNDITDRAQGIAALARRLPAEQFVLDGESIAAGTFFFDCLHLDGADLLDEPLSARRALLESFAQDVAIPATVTDDVAAAEEFAAGALHAGHEGVVVKALDSRYDAGRRGGAWRKVKPVKTFDLVVLGAEWGHGRRSGWLSNLHLGARTGDDRFVMVGKTFKGLTDALLEWQTKALQTIAVRETKHIVFVRPELVVEIALDGVMESDRYEGGVGLRFARVKRYRPDKSPDEADTIDALRALLPHAAAGPA